MRGADIDATGRLWLYRPQRHKTEHHGMRREIPLGPKAQEIVKPFLKPKLEAFLFSPAEAVAEWNAVRRSQRRTPLGPSAKRRRLHRDPTGGAGDRYHGNAYRYAICRACGRAFPLPDDLRKSARQIVAWRADYQKTQARKPSPSDFPEELRPARKHPRLPGCPPLAPEPASAHRRHASSPGIWACGGASNLGAPDAHRHPSVRREERHVGP